MKWNNPLNLRNTSDQWKGKIGSESGFVVFDTVENGLRAAMINMRNAYIKRGLKSIAEIITKWAPPSDNNDTAGYIKYVTEKTFEQEFKMGLPFAAAQFGDCRNKIVEVMYHMHKIEQGKYKLPLSLFHKVNNDNKIF